MLADRPRWIAYAFAAGLIVLTTGVKSVVEALLGVHTHFAFFMFALAVVAWAFGRGPGWMSVLLAGGVYHYFFHEPRTGFSYDPTHLKQLAVFILLGGGITEVLRFAVSTRHKAREFSRQAAQLSKIASDLQSRMQLALGSLTEPFAILTAVRDASGKISDFRVEYMNESGGRDNKVVDPAIKDFTGKLLSEIAPLSRQLGVVDAYARTIETGESYHDELEYTLGANDRRWTELHASKLDDGIVVQWRDTTARHLAEEARRQSEARFRRLYESNQIGVMFYSADGRITDPNDALLGMLKMSREEFNRDGLDWRKMTPPGWEEADRLSWDQLRMHGRCGPLEKEYFRRDGTRIPVLISGANLHVNDHRHGVACVVDLTRSKLVEEQLRQSQTSLLALTDTLERRVAERTAEAEMRSQQLRALALDLAETESRERNRLAKLLHDHFQQLISAAKLKAGLLRRGLKEEKQIESVQQVESLLGEAIAASRSLATELSPPVLSDGGLVSALEWLARKMEKDYELRISLETDPAAEPESEQVRTIVFECVRELLFNIVKHANTHEARLTASQKPDGILSIVIQDRGKGFDLGSAMQRSIIAGQEGSFGLFSIRERLSLLGGLLTIRSEPGVGTTVELTVPVGIRKVTPPAVEAKPLVSRPQSDTSETPTTGGGNGHRHSRLDPAQPVRVLVADDHRLFREGLINLLALEPALTVIGEAADGHEAIELCRKLKPDVLICDVTMPRLNGVQVTRQVTAEFPEVRVIGLSMHEREDMAHAMRNAGAVAYVTKSGPSDQLLSVIRSVTTNQPLESI